MSRGNFNQPRPSNAGPPASSVKVLFDPARSDVELFDTLAEQQAGMLEINSAQLRRFFGEIKDLYRRYSARVAGDTEDARKQQLYHEEIEPLFKMIRSKVSYARRAGGQSKVPDAFAEVLSQGIAKVGDHKQFVRYVRHLEAVVGFMYGMDKVKQR